MEFTVTLNAHKKVRKDQVEIRFMCTQPAEIGLIIVLNLKNQLRSI